MVATSALVSGCTGSGGQIMPTQSSVPMPVVPTTTGPRPTAPPPVTRELDLTPFVGRPCDLFTDADAAELGIRKPTALSVATKDLQSCFSLPPNGEAGLSYVLSFYGSRFGYAFGEDGGSGWIRQLVISGQPAVERSIQEIPSTYCSVVVATAQRQSMTVEFVDRSEDPSKWVCDRATAAADVMVKRLGSG